MQRQVRQLSLALALLGAACTKEEPKPAPKPAPPATAAAEPWKLGAAPRGTYSAGQGGVAVVSITASDGYHVNPDYPVAFKPTNASTVKFASEKVALSDGKKTACLANAEDACLVEFELPFTAASAGPAQLEGIVAFSVCSAEKCLIEKQPVKLAITVN
jgi:hypothetical protein